MRAGRILGSMGVVLAAALVAAAPAPALGAGTAAASATLTVEVSSPVVVAGASVTFSGLLTDLSTGTGMGGRSLTFTRQGDAALIATASTEADGSYTSTPWDVPYGSHTVVARWWPPDFAPAVTAQVAVSGASPSTTILTGPPGPVQQGVPFAVTVRTIADATGYAQAGPHYTFTDVASGTTLPAVIDAQNPYDVPVTYHVTSPLAGDRQLVATFEGDSMTATSTSAPLDVVVEADTSVAAGTPTVSAAVVYPVVDGYGDTVETANTLAEAADVVVRVQSVGTGAILRTEDLGEVTGDGYGWIWDGRTGAGEIAPSGQVRFVHELADRFGNTAQLVSPEVTVSPKKLVWTTVSSVTKAGKSYELKGATGTGWVSTAKSAFSGGVRLKRGNGFAGVTYKATLASVKIPSSATIRRLTVSVHGKGISGGTATIAIYNETLGARKYTESYDCATEVPTPYGWTSSRTSALGVHLDGRNAYLSVVMTRKGMYDIKEVRVTLSYAVLK